MENKKPDKESVKEHFEIVIFIVGIIVIVPFVFHHFFPYGCYWVDFWAKFASAAASIFALYITYKLNRNEHQKTRADIDERNRLQILPYIFIEHTEVDKENIGSGFLIDLSTDRCSLASNVDIDKYYGCGKSAPLNFDLCKIILNNVGNGTLINCALHCSGKESVAPIGFIRIKDDFSFFLMLSFKAAEYNFILNFEDLEKRTYEQTFQVVYGFNDKKEFIRFSKISSPVLINAHSFL